MSDKLEILRDDMATSTWRSVDVDVCKVCKGEGRKLVFVGGKKDEDYDWQKCEICAGSGMVKKRLVVSIFPFNKTEIV